MEQNEQERVREDKHLYNWKMNSQSCDLVTAYKLLHQHYLIKDNNIRNNMINGVGPFNIVNNRMNYDIWRGKRTIKQPDEWDNDRGVNVRGE